METKYYVYKHTNKVNGKVYIGITGRKNPKYRWRNGKGYKKNKHFWRSIQKYGWDKGFTHEILYSGLSMRQAEVMEVSLIAYYDSTDENKGYNDSPGGNLQSEEAKRKISEAHKGKKHTEEHKQKIGESNKGKNNSRSKTVMCITTGQCFSSTGEAARWLNLNSNDGGHIRSCCAGKRKSAYKLPDGTKLTWKYVSDIPKPQLTEADKVHLRYILNKYSA